MNLVKKMSLFFYDHWDWYKQRENNKIAIPIINEIIAEEQKKKNRGDN